MKRSDGSDGRRRGMMGDEKELWETKRSDGKQRGIMGDKEERKGVMGDKEK